MRCHYADAQTARNDRLCAGCILGDTIHLVQTWRPPFPLQTHPREGVASGLSPTGPPHWGPDKLNS